MPPETAPAGPGLQLSGRSPGPGPALLNASHQHQPPRGAAPDSVGPKQSSTPNHNYQSSTTMWGQEHLERHPTTNSRGQDYPERWGQNYPARTGGGYAEVFGEVPVGGDLDVHLEP